MRRQLFIPYLVILAAVVVWGGARFCLAGESSNPSIGKLSLDQAIDLALENSLKYRLAAGEVQIAETKLGQTRSGYFPTLNLSGGISRLNEVPDIVTLGRSLANLNNALAAAGIPLSYQEGPDDGLTYYGLKLLLEQPLYTGGRLSGLNAQARANLEAAHYQLRAAEQDLILEVKKAYYTVLQAQHGLDTLREAVFSMENHVEEARRYFEAGMVAKLDILRAEVKLADVQQKELAAENGFKLAQAYLKFVLGINGGQDFSLEPEPAYTDLDLDLTAAQEKAVAGRVELKALEAQVEMASEGVKIARSGHKPLVGLVAEYDRTETELFAEDPDLSLSLVASFKLWDGGLVKNQVAEAGYRLEQAMTGRQLAEDSIRLEVEQAYRSVQNDLKIIRVAEKNLRQAEETLEMAKISYQAGLITSLERVDAETGLTQAKNDYYLTINQYHLAMAQLRRAMGESF